jgi:transposase
MGTRTSRINALRGFCRELGLHVPVGARTGLEAMGRAIADDRSVIPVLLRPVMQQLLDEIRVLETRVTQLARESTPCKLLMSIAGVGLLTATAIVAATSGSVAHFKSARHFASGQELLGVRHWALTLQARSNHNKAAALWPTSWRASATRSCVSRRPSGSPQPALARRYSASRTTTHRCR